MVIKQSVLLEKSYRYRKEDSQVLETAALKGMKKVVFLCHSHKDEQLVKGILIWFKDLGIDLYVDWQDHSMPDVPNKETAQKIQEKIKKCDGFVFLATASSKASRWCPWEIGYADSSRKDIYIMATADGGSTYGNEYLELYKRMEEVIYGGKNGLAAFEPKETTGKWFSL